MKVTREFVRAGETVRVVAEFVAGDRWRVRVGDRVLDYTAKPLGDGGVRLVPLADDGAAAAAAGFVAYGVTVQKDTMVRVGGHTTTLAAPQSRRGGGAGGGDGTVRAPMTGTVLDVTCKAGDRVEADQTLVVVSAMKMEHKLVAGVAGVVARVAAKKGSTVEQGDELVVVEPAQKGNDG